MSVLKPADPFPSIEFTMMSGGTERLSDHAGHWIMLIVYRGHHCPRCKAYIAHLHELVDAYAKRDVLIRLATTDPEPVVARTIAENQWSLQVAHSLSIEHSKQLGLYITDHDEEYELDGQYAEPGLFLINPEGLTQVIATSNSPSVRPDLDVVLDGIIGTQDRNLPIRGLSSVV